MAEEKSEQEKPKPPQASKKGRCCKCLFWTFSILVAVAAILAGVLWRLVFYHTQIPVEVAESIGDEGIQLFFQHDRDGDGYLSLTEYEALYLLMKDTRTNITHNIVYDETINNGDEVITVTAKFQPLLLESMSREKGLFTSGQDALTGLKNWKFLNEEVLTLAVQHFKVFSPSEYYTEHPGEVYTVIDAEPHFYDRIRGDVGSNRYFPPRLEDKNIVVHRLLSMFHPRPFLMMRFGPQGSLACVRAYNKHYIDIVFRIHAEFQLNEAPRYPFWFTPAQFTGNLVVSRDFKRLLSFNLYVPTTKKLNVDMEWMEGVDSMVVDIGFMPEMSISSTGPSEIPKVWPFRDHRVPAGPSGVDTIQWTQEIPLDTAISNLEKKFYPFKQVKYYNFTDAVKQAQKEDKLIHCILLWGALDDQSC